MKKVSIIVPVYNQEKYISMCLDSLVNQTLKDIEIVIINDGSKDKTEEKIKPYIEKYKDKIVYKKIPNGGVANARNTGLKIATGEYIGFVDSDDFIALDMYEKAIKSNGKTKSRLSVEHLDLTDPADQKRLGKLGVIASVQPPHITLSDSLETNDYPPAIGKERCKNLWAYKTFADNGVVLAFGTDYPVVYDSPMVTLYRAVTRKFPDGKPENGWNPEQRLSIADAIIAYTLGGAKKFGKEDVLGTIRVGKLADIVVVDKNLLKIPADEIPDTKVVFTMVDGRVVYDR